MKQTPEADVRTIPSFTMPSIVVTFRLNPTILAHGIDGIREMLSDSGVPMPGSSSLIAKELIKIGVQAICGHGYDKHEPSSYAIGLVSGSTGQFKLNDPENRLAQALAVKLRQPLHEPLVEPSITAHERLEASLVTLTRAEMKDVRKIQLAIDSEVIELTDSILAEEITMTADHRTRIMVWTVWMGYRDRISSVILPHVESCFNHHWNKKGE